MKKGMMVAGVLIVVVIMIGLIGGSSYNKMVALSEETNTQWSIVESKLQRRFDLIPNLVKTVKGAMGHEKEVFENIAEARAKLAGAKNISEKVAASNEMEAGLGKLLMVMENYPQLKSIDSVNKLMDELSGTENRISVERDRYNESVKSYNTYITTLPRVFYASKFGFEERAYFEANQGAENSPSIDLGN